MNYFVKKIKVLLPFAIILCLLLANASKVHAKENQDISKKISIQFKNKTLKDALVDLEKKSDFLFFFKDDLLDKYQKKINTKYEGKTVTEILTSLFDDTNNVFTVNGRQIIIHRKVQDKKEPKPQQEKEGVTVNGIVVDENGETLPGVVITNKSNKNAGASSDIDGKFTFSNLRLGDQLVFSFIGMETVEVTVKKDNEYFSVTMKTSETQLKAVVVETGMFQRDKATFTGSTSTYKADDIKAIGNQNIVQSLKALDPSFIVMDNMEMGADPNTMPNISFRGGGSSSLNAITDEFSKDPNMPLFIVNGVESSISRVVDLDMNRVESVTILKDAGSTAIYGSRGANGVVVIELTKPKPGELKIYYTGGLSLDIPDLSVYNMMNAREKLEFERLSMKYSSADPLFQKELNKLYNSRLADIERGVDTYWLSEPVRTGINHSHSARVSGGNKELSIDVGLKYNNREGAMKGSVRETWSGDVNLTYRTDKIVVSNFLDVSGYNAEDSPYGNFSDWVNTNPYFRKRNIDGGIDKFLQYRDGEGSIPGSSSIVNDVPNPLYNAMLNSRYNTDEVNIVNDFSIVYTPIEDLRLKSGLTLERTQNKRDNFTAPEHTKYRFKTLYEQGEYSGKNYKSLEYRGYIDGSYAKLINGHSFTVFAQGELRQAKQESSTFEAQGFPYGSKGTPNLAYSYKTNSKPSYNLSDSRAVSFTAVANYNYMKRYLFDFTYKLEGATTFGSNELYKSFWTVGLGWNINEEPFMKNMKWLEILKLRASIGTNGNQQQGRVTSKNIYNLSLHSNFFDQGLYFSELANPDLPWQIEEKKEIGIDFRALQGKVSANIGYFHNKKDPYILFVNQAPSTGVDKYPMELGTLTNQGIEFNLVYNPIYNLKDRIIWQITLTGLYNKNQYDGFGSISERLNASYLEGNEMRRYMDGCGPEDIWAVRSAGIDPATGDEVFIKKNGELTKEYDVKDQVVVGTLAPNMQGIIGTSIRYKNFSAQLSMKYSLGGDIYNSALFNKVENIDKEALERNQDKRALYDRWKAPGDISKFKRISDVTSKSSSETFRSSRFVQKNNFLRGESISLSYELNNNPWLRRNFGVQYVKLSGYLNNIFWAETSKTERGITYPFTRTISFGLNLSF